MRCSKCGFDNPGGMKFCGQCTTPLSLVCPNCHFENPPGFKFCGQCTTALGAGSPIQRSSNPTVATSETDGRAAVDGERKTVTALFADIKGSMELMEDLDPEEARAIIDPALKLMIEAIGHFDGYIVQSTGDGIFALFGAPVAREDHPQRALYAALRLQDEMRRFSARLRQAGHLPVEARVGVNTGEVVVRSIATTEGHAEYTPIGHSISLAARMQALAPTGSIAATDNTRKLCEGYFIFRTLGHTPVKGVSEPVEVFELSGMGPLRTRLQVAMRRGLTRFVGREAELVQMRQALDLVRSGHGQILAAIGEPGVGKSRLVYEFKAVSQRGTLTLEAYSVSHGKASAYLPVIELLRDYFGILPEDEARRRREKVAGKIVILDRALEDTLTYLYLLLGIGEADDPLAQMDAQIRRRRMHEALKRIFLRESLNQPLILIFEDLHWIDSETQAVLNQLAEALPNARILLLVNYRPEYRHDWGNRGYYTQLRLDPLGTQNADEMLEGLLGDGPELETLKRMITERTQGNPFFIEEMVQALFETGALQRNGTVKLTRPLAQIRVPPTVQGMLAARIDRLTADEKDLLQTAAVIGREFSRRLILRVSGRTEEEIERTTTELRVGEFIYEQPAIHDDEYSFKHALTQEVAYNSVLSERRKLLHERIGEAIESLFAGRLEEHLDELARHYRQSNKTAKAIEYLYLAGEQARNRAAYSEAATCLDDALQVLAATPEDTDRVRTELKLQIALAEALAPATLYGAFTDYRAQSDQAERALNRARELCDQVGDANQVFQVLYMLRMRHFFRLELEDALRLDEQLVALAEKAQVSEMLTAAYAAGGLDLMVQGRLVEARVLLEKAISPSAVAHHGGPVDPRVVALISLAQILWFLGYPEQARNYEGQAMTTARCGAHTYSIAGALYWTAWLDHLLGDLAAASDKADSALRMAEEYGFVTPALAARWIKAWILIRRGVIKEGLEQFDGLLTQMMVHRVASPIRVLVVDAALGCGRIKEGLDTVADAFAQMQSCGDRIFEAEFHRLKGELLLRHRATIAEAESCFRAAIEVARTQQAKSWELRATTSLARLLANQGRLDEARAMLGEIYNWFTEGFDTTDLKDAKALLDDLTANSRWSNS